MDDEVDYMSDAILNEIEDVKPGLFISRDVQRQRTVEANRRKNKCLSKSEREIHHLKEGLKKKVGPENKGFSLLSKMGYVPGKGLGKNATGIADPVSIEIPQGREGLGFASEKNERMIFRENLKQKIQIAYKDEFRSTMAVRFRQNRLNRQLDVARRICQDLDLKELIETPVHESFWPPIDLVPTEVADNDNDLAKLDSKHANCDYTSVQRNFIQLLNYLRSRHNYCFWCSLQYQNQSELLEQCPGEDEDQHD